MSSASNQPERIVFHDLGEAYRESERQREVIRRNHNLTLVSEKDDGAGIHRLPEGVFGFTYSPGLSDSPVFRKSGLRAFEMHKHSGDEFIVGFASPEGAGKVTSAPEPFEIDVYPGPEGDNNAIVEVPASRMLHLRPHSQREFGALRIRMAPAR
ncbi:MAG: hypothetical protein ACKV22_33045 [Bryobacteraceae bacterium]